MSSVQPYASGGPSRGGDTLADVLERVLDKGIVVAGDIQINLVDVELLSIKLRLLIASADTARSMGIDWWQGDPFLSSDAKESAAQGGQGELAQQNAQLRDRVNQLEQRLEQVLDALPANDDARAQQRSGGGGSS